MKNNSADFYTLSRMVRPENGEVVWILDSAAAANL